MRREARRKKKAETKRQRGRRGKRRGREGGWESIAFSEGCTPQWLTGQVSLSPLPCLLSLPGASQRFTFFLQAHMLHVCVCRHRDLRTVMHDVPLSKQHSWGTLTRPLNSHGFPISTLATSHSSIPIITNTQTAHSCACPQLSPHYYRHIHTLFRYMLTIPFLTATTLPIPSNTNTSSSSFLTAPTLQPQA